MSNTPLEINFRVINSVVPFQTKLTVIKEWDDMNDVERLRPDSVQVQLYDMVANQTIGMPVTLTESGTYTWTELKQYKGNSTAYKAVEENVPEHYNMTSTEEFADGKYVTKITNILKPIYVSFILNKQWKDDNDQDYKRPENFKVQLLKNNEPHGPIVTISSTVNEYAWPRLVKYENGQKVNYGLQEVDVAQGYQATVELVGNTFILTNTYQPEKVNILVNKVWNDQTNQDGLRPVLVRVELLKNDVPTGKSVVLEEGNGWSNAFDNLDKFENGALINYTVQEHTVEGYSSAVSGNIDHGFVLTNTHAPETITISGTKTRDDHNN